MDIFDVSNINIQNAKTKEIENYSMEDERYFLSIQDDFINEIEFRLENVKVYKPITDILSKRESSNPITKFIPELSFLVLGFLIYEGKLKNKGLSLREIDSFISLFLAKTDIYEFGENSYNELTREILNALQNDGKNFIQEVFDFKSKSLKEKYVKFIEIKQSDEGFLLYYITEQGVDFYLKTKEFPEETKVTVNLILFQKQMEKGSFNYAYETLKRLNLEVQNKIDKKNSILQSHMYGQSGMLKEYYKYQDGAMMHLKEEEDLFKVVIVIVQDAYTEYLDMTNKSESTEKDKEIFQLIKKIEREIIKAQELHTNLLKEVVAFIREYDNVSKERLKSIFTEKFKFEKEFNTLVRNNESPETLKYLFEPLLSPKLKKSFNPLRILEPISIQKEDYIEPESESLEKDLSRETIDQITKRRVLNSFLFYAKNLLTLLLNANAPVNLKVFCDELIAKYSQDSIYNGDFISFIVDINKGKEIGSSFKIIELIENEESIGEELKSIEEVFTVAATQIKIRNSIKKVTVNRIGDDELDILPGIKISNMEFQGEWFDD